MTTAAIAARSRGAAEHAAGLNGLNDGQRISYEVVKERGKEAAADLKLY